MRLGIKNFFALLLVLVVAAGAWAAVQRHLSLKDNRKVELAIDSRLLLAQSLHDGLNTPEQLEELQEAGCTAVGVRPLTITDLESMGQVTLLDTAEIQRLQMLGLLDGFSGRDGRELPGSGGLFVFTEDRELHKALQAALSPLLRDTVDSRAERNASVFSGGGAVFIPRSFVSAMKDLPLIMPREQMLLWSAAGLKIIPYFYAPPQISPELSEQYWGALASQLENIIEEEDISMGPVAFPSPSFTYPAPEGSAGVFFAEKGLTLGAVEFTAGKALGKLAARLNYRIVRAHQIATAELGQLGEERSSERFLRAVQERSVRLLLLNPFPELDPRGKFPAYLQFVSKVAGDLKKAGFEVGECSPFPFFSVPAGVQALLFAGTAASAAFLVGLFFLGKNKLIPPRGKKKRKLRAAGATETPGTPRMLGTPETFPDTTSPEILGTAGLPGGIPNPPGIFATKSQRLKARLDRQNKRIFIAFSLCLLLTAAALPLFYKIFVPAIATGGEVPLLSRLPSPVFLEKAAALLASLVFPTLGVILFLEPALSRQRKRGYLTETVKGFLCCTLFTTGGALAASGILGDTTYILKIEAFGGVKISQVGPFILLGIFILQQKRGKLWNEITALLNKEVKVKYLLALILAGGVLLVYLVRGGNIPLLPVSEIELTLRRQLELIFIARPRFKEFLIGHPGLFLMAALCPAGVRGAKTLALVLGLLGQISLFNTFMHLHRPVSLSLLGTFYGAALGLLAGLVLFYLAARVYASLSASINTSSKQNS